VCSWIFDLESLWGDDEIVAVHRASAAETAGTTVRLDDDGTLNFLWQIQRGAQVVGNIRDNDSAEDRGFFRR